VYDARAPMHNKTIALANIAVVGFPLPTSSPLEPDVDVDVDDDANAAGGQCK